MGNFKEKVKAKWHATKEWVYEHKVEVGMGVALVLVFVGGVWVVKDGDSIKSPSNHLLMSIKF